MRAASGRSGWMVGMSAPHAAGTTQDTVRQALGPVEHIDVAGTDLAVRRLGAGPGTPVLLLHGVPETGASWHRIAPALAATRRVIVPDLPGLGESASLPENAAADVAAVLDAACEGLVGGGPIDVVGHDLGGLAAAALAGIRPERVRRLVLVSAPYRWFDVTRALHVPFFATPRVPERVLRGLGRRAAPLMYRAAGLRDLDPAVREHAAAAYGDPARQAAMLDWYRSNARRPGVPDAPDARAEQAWVVGGAADPIITPRVVETAAKRLGSSIAPGAVHTVLFPGVGHWPQHEVPDALVDLLLTALG